jgi:hypothetical protein
MCFTPTVSLITAIFEFLVIAFILIRFKRTVLIKFLVVFLFLLGFYQFTEFMLCTTGMSIWITIGFMTYTFLPAVGMHFVVNFTSMKSGISEWLFYVPAILFSLVAILSADFVVWYGCSGVYVAAQTLISNPLSLGIVSMLYILYYFGFIFVVCALLINRMKHEKVKKRIQVHTLALIATLVSLVPALILIVIFPSLGIMFPSMYCEFAVIFAVLAIIGAYMDKRIHKNK